LSPPHLSPLVSILPACSKFKCWRVRW
jgi:hypothetical protein